MDPLYTDLKYLKLFLKLTVFLFQVHLLLLFLTPCDPTSQNIGKFIFPFQWQAAALWRDKGPNQVTGTFYSVVSTAAYRSASHSWKKTPILPTYYHHVKPDFLLWEGRATEAGASPQHIAHFRYPFQENCKTLVQGKRNLGKISKRYFKKLLHVTNCNHWDYYNLALYQHLKTQFHVPEIVQVHSERTHPSPEVFSYQQRSKMFSGVLQQIACQMVLLQLDNLAMSGK